MTGWAEGRSQRRTNVEESLRHGAGKEHRDKSVSATELRAH